MKTPRLILILADQLSPANPALALADKARDVILFAEVAEEATYVRHNRHKIVLLFSAMRHFAKDLEDQGFAVQYVPFDQGVSSLKDACRTTLDSTGCGEVIICEPGEYRLSSAMKSWSPELGVPVEVL
ncbi:MAG: cryptochrome/photolyase family protein, partial [Cellvibrionales bacterium]|nr:cryptochrome/photolyase family protein [Cellvibrionales bacterium]